MDYIIFNGTDSRTLGVIVEKLPDFHRAARRVEQNVVPGRSGVVMADAGGYDIAQTDIRINCNGVSLWDIHKWLRGEGWLISSDEPDRKVWAYMSAQASDSRYRALDENGQTGTFDSVSVDVLLEPFMRLVSESAIALTEPDTFTGQGSDEAMPSVTVTGSGDIELMINGATVLIDGLSGSITLDCEAGIAFRMDEGEMVWAGEMVTLIGGWPTLKPSGQTNTVNWSGSVTSVSIQPQWRII